MKYLFRIGNWDFSISATDEITIPNNFLKFKRDAEEDCDDIDQFIVTVDDKLYEPAGDNIIQRKDMRIIQDGDREHRLIGSNYHHAFVASYEEVSNRKNVITVGRPFINDLIYDTVFTSLIAPERHLIAYEELIFHCAYIRYKGQAILFSAPSGTGKSTQAELWKKYRGAETINGDKALLQKINGTWSAGGWPVCGTSGVCHNETTPIRAIVMLSQGPSDTIELLRPIKAFTQLYPQVTINSWNRGFTERVMRNIDDLITSIPIYHLSCTISENAVRCLEQVL